MTICKQVCQIFLKNWKELCKLIYSNICGHNSILSFKFLFIT